MVNYKVRWLIVDNNDTYSKVEYVSGTSESDAIESVINLAAKTTGFHKSKVQITLIEEAE